MGYLSDFISSHLISNVNKLLCNVFQNNSIDSRLIILNVSDVSGLLKDDPLGIEELSDEELDNDWRYFPTDLFNNSNNNKLLDKGKIITGFTASLLADLQMNNA